MDKGRKDIEIEKLDDLVAKLTKEQERGWTRMLPPYISAVFFVAMAFVWYAYLFPGQIIFPLLLLAAAMWIPISWAFIRPRNIDKHLTRLKKERADFLKLQGEPVVETGGPHLKNPAIGKVLDGYKTCPFCAERIQMAAVKCRFCSEMLETKSP